MGIFAQQTINSTPLVTDVVLGIKRANSMLFSGLYRQIVVIFNMIWKNPNYTPGQIMDAFGTDGQTLFGVFNQLQQMMQAVDPTYVPITPPAQYVVTPNADGSISITDAPIVATPVATPAQPAPVVAATPVAGS